MSRLITHFLQNRKEQNCFSEYWNQDSLFSSHFRARGTLLQYIAPVTDKRILHHSFSLSRPECRYIVYRPLRDILVFFTNSPPWPTMDSVLEPILNSPTGCSWLWFHRPFGNPCSFTRPDYSWRGNPLVFRGKTFTIILCDLSKHFDCPVIPRHTRISCSYFLFGIIFQ